MLVKRAEDAEAALKPVPEELVGLKKHITQMTAAILGKAHMHFILILLLSRLATLNFYCLTRLATDEQATKALALAKI